MAAEETETLARLEAKIGPIVLTLPCSAVSALAGRHRFVCREKAFVREAVLRSPEILAALGDEICEAQRIASASTQETAPPREPSRELSELAEALERSLADGPGQGSIPACGTEYSPRAGDRAAARAKEILRQGEQDLHLPLPAGLAAFADAPTLGPGELKTLRSLSAREQGHIRRQRGIRQEARAVSEGDVCHGRAQTFLCGTYPCEIRIAHAGEGARRLYRLRLIGRPDAVRIGHDNTKTVVEIKTRMTPRARANSYDLDQLACYVMLAGAQHGELRQRLSDGRVVSATYPKAELEPRWRELLSGLAVVARWTEDLVFGDQALKRELMPFIVAHLADAARARARSAQ